MFTIFFLVGIKIMSIMNKGGDVFFFKSTILQFEGSKNDLIGKKQMKCIIYLQDSSKIYAFMTYNI